MVRLRSVLPAVLAAALGCATREPLARTARARAEMRALERDYLDALSRRNPEEATALGFPGADHAAVRDDAPEAIAAWREAEDALLARARAVDARALAGTPEGVARGILVEALEGARGVRACRFELWPVSADGWQLDVAARAEEQPVATAQLRAAARARVSGLARRIRVEIENLREGVRLGYVATRENVERVLADLDRLLAAPPASWPTLRAALDGDATFGTELAAAVERDILPAAGRYRDFLRSEYLEHARRKPSLLALPDGELCYRAAVRHQVTLELDPQAIHETGLARVQELHLEMRRIAERSFGTSDVPALLRRLGQDPSLGFPARAVAALRDPLRPDRPRTATALGGRGPEIARYVPRAAFVGGWALYSERLALERRPSSADAERLGVLAREAFRAARLVVDPGVNVLGWRREHAIEYLVANAGLSPESAAWEVDRCAARPGEATASTLGALEILRLRSEAERALGRRFDLRAFHDAVLESGAVTLPMLRERVARFVRERGGEKRGR